MGGHIRGGFRNGPGVVRSLIGVGRDVVASLIGRARSPQDDEQAQRTGDDGLPPLTGKVWIVDRHKGRDDSILFWRNEDGPPLRRRRWTGHTTPHPAVGDVFEAPMKSNARARFVVLEVDPCLDPHDMWFATTDEGVYIDDETGREITGE